MKDYKKANEENTQKVNIENFNKDTTLLITVDMINGFIREGVLASPRVERIIPAVEKLNKNLSKAKRLFFVDEHEEDAIEFKAFPPHCLKGSSESKIIDELVPYIDGATVIGKNSINGFFAPDFTKFLNENLDKINKVIVTGCCTDLCIENISLSLKTFLNQNNKDVDVCVVTNGVETYDLGEHKGDEVNIMALYNMHVAGIKLVEI